MTLPASVPVSSSSSSSSPSPSVGDLTFFRGDPHNALDRIIMRRTKSDWVHVGIVLDYGLMISARSDGVRIEALPSGATIAATGSRLVYRDDAIRWVLERSGEAYGFGDILNQLILWVNAQTPSWLDIPTLDFARHRDCSHLALDVLRVGGYPFSANDHITLLQPERVTPGALFDILA